MHTSPAISYELAQARINDLRYTLVRDRLRGDIDNDLRHQAQRARVARAAQAEPQLRKPLVHGRLHLRAAGRPRIAPLGS